MENYRIPLKCRQIKNPLDFTLLTFYDSLMLENARTCFHNFDQNYSPSPEEKYVFQIGMKDVDFAVNWSLLKIKGYNVPLKGITEAEGALCDNALLINSFREMDDTEHQVLSFDPRPVGYSGFMNCVKHSLMMTNHGVFEVGRYAGATYEPAGYSWQWFLHKRLITPIQVSSILEEQGLTPDEFILEMTQLILD